MISALTTILSRPKTVLTMMVVMLIAGIATYISIPKESNPNIEIPVYFVSINQQGISPEDAERLLVRPMETELRGMEGLKEITAYGAQNHAGVVLEFDISTDKDEVLADLRDKVDKAKAKLPADADEPTISETNFNLQPTIIVALSGAVPERTLYNHARQLKDQIEAISTVSEVNMTGQREEVLEVILDLTALESYNVTPIELLNALRNNNVLVPAGTFDDGNGRFAIKVPGLVETAQDVYNITIKQNDEGVVTIGDVTTLQRSFKDPHQYTRVNGQKAISLDVVKRIGTNIIENNTEVRKVVEEFTQEWPDTISVDLMLDQSNSIFEVLGSLQSSIMTSIFLVMVVVVGALGLKSGFLVGFAIPTSFMIGFLILASAGMTVNTMVMFGLVLCVGMLVDGAIVVTEYADRKLSEGVPADEAYTRAAQLMFWPVVSSTATTLAAFLPMLLWPGVPGQFMSYLPIMVIIVLSASLLTALVFLPSMGIAISQFSSFIARNVGIVTGGLVALAVGFLVFSAAQTALGFAALPIAIGAGLLFGFLASSLANILSRRRRTDKVSIDTTQADMLSSRSSLDTQKLTGFVGAYLRFLRLFTANIVGNVIAIFAVVALTVGSFMLFPKYSNGVEFFVNEEPDVAIVLVSARGNLSAENIGTLVREVETEVLKVKGIKSVVSTATAPGGGGGGGGGAPAAVQDVPPDIVGTLQIEFLNYCCRRKAVEIFAEIRERTSGIAGIKVETRKIEGGPPTGKDIRLEVKSTEYDVLVATVAQLRNFFDAQPFLIDQEDGRPLPGIEWQLNVDREAAGRFGADMGSIGTMVQLITNGVLVGNYRPTDAQDEVDIRVRVPKEQRNLGAIEDLRLPTASGQVPLGNFITREPVQQTTNINRRDGLYAMDLKATVAIDASGEKVMTNDDAVGKIEEFLKAQNFPENVQWQFRGADEEQQESGQFLMMAGMGAMFLMFIILLTQFNSFYQTFITLGTVIMAVAGVLVGMMVTGQKFSIIMTGTGIVALAGIVVNNAIVLIDTFNRLRSEGVSDVREAILKTTGQRMRPILLTTSTTMLGLLPMALQINLNFIGHTISFGGITSIWWVQLSTAIIFGLAFSTILTLLFIPVMLTLPGNIVALWLQRFGSKVHTQPKVSASSNKKKAISEENAEPLAQDGAGEFERPQKHGRQSKKKHKSDNDDGSHVLPEAAE